MVPADMSATQTPRHAIASILEFARGELVEPRARPSASAEASADKPTGSGRACLVSALTDQSNQQSISEKRANICDAPETPVAAAYSIANGATASAPIVAASSAR